MNPMLPDATIPTVASAVIVDDSALHRRHGADLCRELGIALVHEAANGREVLALLDVLDPAPNVLIVDLEMPTMDGPELLEHLAQRGISLPIILASSRERALIESVQDMAGALGLHVVAALQKPLRIRTLRAALQDLGCTLAQGWLTAKPMPAAEFTPWLKRHLARKGELRSSAVTGRGSGRKYADAQPARD
jgi:CheY-like chemotaxis protein